MHSLPPPQRFLLGILLTVASPVAAQMPFHDRGPGELLPPPIQPDRIVQSALAADLTDSAFLWAFQRDALLQERALQPLAPATLTAIVKALLAASRGSDRELRWQSLWALARIARHDAALAPGLHERVLGSELLRGDDAPAEVAAVAIGLAAHGDAKVMAALTSIATDGAAAERSRGFAFLGLGLAAEGSRAEAVQFRVLAAIERALLVGSEAPPQVRVAALHALALTRLDVAPRLQGPALALLERAWAEESPAAPIEFAAHVPIAVAAVVPAADPAAEAWRARFAIAARTKSSSPAIARSCVLALGALCRPWQDATSPDAKYGEVLRTLATEARDVQSRYYAWFAMGRAGGAQHRAFLLQGMNKAPLVKPWAAFGLAATTTRSDTTDVEIVQVLEQNLQATKHPSIRSALAAALQVARRDPVSDLAQEFRLRYATLLPGKGDADARCLSLLEVLEDPAATPADRRLAAMALGHLGDRGRRHWSSALARAIDYRSGTPVLLGLSNGVLRLP